MTLLGKVFTVLIFIMSLVFMTFAVAVFATHKNWKMYVTNETPNEQYDLGLIHQLAQLKEANVNLRSEMETLRSETAKEQAARRHAIGVLETKLAEVAQSLTDREAELRALQVSEGESAEALKVATQVVDALQDELKLLRVEIRSTQDDRDTQFNKLVQATDLYHSAQGFLQNFKERNLQLAAQISEYKRVMDANGLTRDMDTTGIAPPLDGIVTAVGDRNLIEISLGSDDGLRVGHRVEVYRSNAYLGYAVVLKTDPDRAVAQVDEKTQRGLVKVRDSVATKLSRTRTG